MRHGKHFGERSLQGETDLRAGTAIATEDCVV